MTSMKCTAVLWGTDYYESDIMDHDTRYCCRCRLHMFPKISVKTELWNPKLCLHRYFRNFFVICLCKHFLEFLCKLSV